jgi:hypothetical protein
MASIDHISDSDDGSDAVDVIQTMEKKGSARELSIPSTDLSHRFRESPQVPKDDRLRVRSSTSEEKRIAVMIEGPSRPWEYQPYVADMTVDTVLAELDPKGGKVWYRIEYEDGRREDVSVGIFRIRSRFQCIAFCQSVCLKQPAEVFEACCHMTVAIP